MSDSTKKIIRFGSILLGIILIIVFSLRFANAYQKFNDDMAAADLRIAELQKEILSENARLDEIESQYAEVRSGVYNMKDAGMAVASLQTKMAGPAYRAEVSGSEKDADTVVNLKAEMMAYLADGEYAEVWIKWPNNVTNYAWRFVTAQDYVDKDVPCLWLCTKVGDDSSVAALAYAEYDVANSVFYNIHVELTDAGRALMEQQGG